MISTEEIVDEESKELREMAIEERQELLKAIDYMENQVTVS
jgi:hypothetical protein